ncbi:MAG: L-seryl-tRNA(Sec) selenium transferase [Lachnospiraceae bacterium]
MNRELLQHLPKVDELLSDISRQTRFSDVTREQMADIIREVIDEKRRSILAGSSVDDSMLKYDTILNEVADRIIFFRRRSLRRVINATGVVLHTNLGRARLSQEAIDAVTEAAANYSTLEYDPVAGRRGSRHDHVERLIRKITGAEAAMVVNNNAAATMITLTVTGYGHEIILSRGEMVEIGGSFRVPEIMEQSGARLVEIGTTNKTKLSDYENHITPDTSALLKVHTSNYKVIGFTESVSIKELKELGRRYNLPVIYDMGSGLMTDLTPYGVDEPTVKAALADGADIVLFSGDKLLGGPQGGVIIGKKEWIDKMKKHPLARVLRVDKMTLAAMEATFRSYYNDQKAKEEIPVLRMITASADQMRAAALRMADLLASLPGACDGVRISIEPVEDKVGGGSAPASGLAGSALAVEAGRISPDQIEAALREGDVPVIVRINHDKVILDPRTMTEEEQDYAVRKLAEILTRG